MGLCSKTRMYYSNGTNSRRTSGPYNSPVFVHSSRRSPVGISSTLKKTSQKRTLKKAIRQSVRGAPWRALRRGICDQHRSGQGTADRSGTEQRRGRTAGGVSVQQARRGDAVHEERDRHDGQQHGGGTHRHAWRLSFFQRQRGWSAYADNTQSSRHCAPHSCVRR